MSKSIYRKLKDYIYKGDGYSTSIFGNLMSKECVFSFENPKKENDFIEWSYVGIYSHEMDFLLNYYVIGLRAGYKIIKDTIKPVLYVFLDKEKREL